MAVHIVKAPIDDDDIKLTAQIVKAPTDVCEHTRHDLIHMMHAFIGQLHSHAEAREVVVVQVDPAR